LPRDVGVILVAAGSGSRIGGLPKQYRPIAGVPMLLRALRPFTAHREVAHVVVVLPAGQTRRPPEFLAGVAGGSLTLVEGGPERSDSVAAGLAALDADCAIVLVHDAARPFVQVEVIDAVVAVARSGVAAIAATPLTDTIKEVTADDPLRVMRTVPRDRLWRAQTPQGFPRALLVEAHDRARRAGLSATDDAALVERLGATVVVVPDSPRNIKITTPEDLAWADAWAARQ
jgi:2-C-methyl-D-erythritol 4-phosphate cytidylyltransferase